MGRKNLIVEVAKIQLGGRQGQRVTGEGSPHKGGGPPDEGRLVCRISLKKENPQVKEHIEKGVVPVPQCI